MKLKYISEYNSIRDPKLSSDIKNLWTMWKHVWVYIKKGVCPLRSTRVSIILFKIKKTRVPVIVQVLDVYDTSIFGNNWWKTSNFRYSKFCFQIYTLINFNWIVDMHKQISLLLQRIDESYMLWIIFVKSTWEYFAGYLPFSFNKLTEIGR